MQSSLLNNLIYLSELRSVWSFRTAILSGYFASTRAVTDGRAVGLLTFRKYSRWKLVPWINQTIRSFEGWLTNGQPTLSLGHSQILQEYRARGRRQTHSKKVGSDISYYNVHCRQRKICARHVAHTCWFRAHQGVKTDLGEQVSSRWDVLQSTVERLIMFSYCPYLYTHIATFCNALYNSGLADNRISSTCFEGQVGTCANVISDYMGSELQMN